MSEAGRASPPSGSAAYAACDWGTTSFRLWLVSDSGEQLRSRRSDEGMITAAETGFSTILEGHLAALGAPADLPVVICGMAGARQGWAEAPYIETPAAIGSLAAGAIAVGETGRTIRILPGVCQRSEGRFDVMRGEETKLLGLAIGGRADGLACLPGTHSKWAVIEGGAIRAFSTFMTGELYALLGKHSVLRFSLTTPEDLDAVAADFDRGVAEALDDPAGLTGKLFSLRAESLLAETDPQRLSAKLSGLLIGVEVAAARQRFGTRGPVTLVASGTFAKLYSAALAQAGLGVELADAETLVRAGLHAAARDLFAL